MSADRRARGRSLRVVMRQRAALRLLNAGWTDRDIARAAGVAGLTNPIRQTRNQEKNEALIAPPKVYPRQLIDHRATLHELWPVHGSQE